MSTPRRTGTIETASAYVLRGGVVLSSVVMLAGLAIAGARGAVTMQSIGHTRFDYHPSAILHGVVRGDGQSLIELGIYLLVLTPVTRVFTSAVLFAVVERDWLYTLITIGVLGLTLTGLLWLG
jgi:uncharacterized membrane protein